MNTIGLRVSALQVLLHILGFLLFYIGLIVLGLSLFLGAFLLSWWIVASGFDLVSFHAKAVIFLAVTLVAIWAVAFMVGFYLIKPLFGWSLQQNEEQIEIHREQAPRLFAVIDDLCRKTGAARPAHVYLSGDVNACVFYDTHFWSIFWPTRKNLQIGLGLCVSTNISELRAILAHEMGHFSQQTMRFGESVYVLHHILSSLIYTDDAYDKWLDTWCESPWRYWSWFGRLTRFFTIEVKKLNRRMFRGVQKSYWVLSHQMELDADRVAISAEGSAAFISAMNKISITMQRQNLYDQFLENFAQEVQKTPQDYWDGWKCIEHELEENDQSFLSAGTFWMRPASLWTKDRSRLELQNIWSSHPPLSERIAQAVRLQVAKADEDMTPSWSLFPREFCSQIGVEMLAGLGVEKLQAAGNKEFGDWVRHELETFFIPFALRPFFDREFLPFALEEIPAAAPCAPSPFEEKNAELLLKLEAARNDLHLLRAVGCGEIAVEEIRYQGRLYGLHDLPLQEQEQYVASLTEKSQVIDQQIYAWLLTHSEKKEDVCARYATLFYADAFLREMPSLQLARDDLLAQWELQQKNPEDEDVREKKQVLLENYVHLLQGRLQKISRRELAKVIARGYLEHLETIHASLQAQSREPLEEKMEKLLPLADSLEEIHEHLKRYAKAEIVSLTKSARKGLFRQLSPTAT